MDRPPQPQQQQRKAIVCDFGALAGEQADVALGEQADVALVDALARLQLILRRYDLEIVLRGAPEELVELIELVGLSDVLRVEPRGQPEQREQRGGVEEERELDDLPP
jgi:ABC-type transporter Mla MlaB component